MRPKFHDLMEHAFFRRFNYLDALGAAEPERMAMERAAFGAYVQRFMKAEDAADGGCSGGPPTATTASASSS